VPKSLVFVYILEPIFGDQKALAFTPEQYKEAEDILGGVIYSQIIHFSN